MKHQSYKTPTRLRRISVAVGLALSAAASMPALSAGTPYTGTPIALPATFEAENFDKGGQGNGYNDKTQNNTGGQYRTSEGVDIIASTDSAGGGYVVNNFQTGEWMAYTINVPTAGAYDIALRASNRYASGPAFHIEVDGVNVTGTVSVPQTADWNTFQWVTKTGVNLPAGTHVLKVVADGQYFNLNQIRISGPAVAATATPYSGTAIALPGNFEAENFDKGGEGLGYHDLSKGNSGASYRTSEDVDIVPSPDTSTGGYIINNFQTGEWLAYSVNAATAGNYDIGVRVANNYTTQTPSFHLELDGAKVGGTVNVPNTGGWDQFKTVTVSGVAIPAGKHTLKIVADAQYFNLDSVSVTAPAATATYSGTPYTGTAIALPASFAAVNFDKGGQSVAYKDLSTGNLGNLYRTSEDVDIIDSGDTQSFGAPYVVNNLQTGEWMRYTVNVPSDGNYDLSLRAATSYTSGPAFHFEVDDVKVGSNVSVPSTGSWTTFQWFGTQNVPLKAGKHVLKVVADGQYLNVNGVSVLASGTSTGGTTSGGTTSGGTTSGGTTSGGTSVPPVGGAVKWVCDFVTGVSECGMFAQQAASNRTTVTTSAARSNSTAIRLHTEPGDTNIAGSGDWERNDITMPNEDPSYCHQGQEEWWAMSSFFPSDYVSPLEGGGGVVMDFHHNGSGGQANFHIDAMPDSMGLRLRGYGGPVVEGGRYEVVIGKVQRNIWYDWTFHVKWSDGSDGIMEAWLNGKKVMAHYGPTLYTGINCYLKLANYHSPTGTPSSVIWDRVIRGTSAAAVAIGTLEGVQ